VNLARLDALKKNIRDTAGNIPYEIISFDNRKTGRPIAWVYNHCASKARYPNLLFIHEDAGFKESGWMERIADKLREPDCGVIGFAGSRIMVNAPGGWNVMPRWCVWNFEECGESKSLNADSQNPFVEVVAVDGFAMFVRKSIWEKYQLDEKLLTGFHCYDVDFSLCVGGRFRNYVCCDISVYHNSGGNFGKEWAAETLKLYSRKWMMVLPRYVAGRELTDAERIKMEERVTFRFLKMASRYRLPLQDIKSKFLKYPLTLRHLEHILKYCLFSCR